MNNNRDVLHQWLVEQLEILEGDESLAVVGLKIIAGGDDRTIYEMKLGQPRWGDAAAMADVLWTQATRTAKGLPGFCQFQAEAVFGKQQGVKPTRFLPFGLMGATQLGPSAGGTAFGGLATEAPTPFGQLSQGMRLSEMLVQGAFNLITHVTNVMQKELERKDTRIETMEKRLDEQWLALKQALLEIQNSAISNAMKALQMEAVKKLIVLAPGLVNMMTGRDVFPPSAVDSSLIESMAANMTPEEQGAVVAWLQSSPNGAPVAAVITDQLSKHRKRKAAETEELQRLGTGLPQRSYDEALSDAGGGVLRVLKGEPLRPEEPEPKPLVESSATVKKIVAEAETVEESPSTTNGTANGHAEMSVDSDIMLKLFLNTTRDQLVLLKPMLGDEVAAQVLARYDQLKREGKLPSD